MQIETITDASILGAGVEHHRVASDFTTINQIKSLVTVMERAPVVKTRVCIVLLGKNEFRSYSDTIGANEYAANTFLPTRTCQQSEPDRLCHVSIRRSLRLHAQVEIASCERAKFTSTATIACVDDGRIPDGFTLNNIGSLEGTLQYYYHAGFSWGCMVLVLKGSF